MGTPQLACGSFVPGGVPTMRCGCDQWTAVAAAGQHDAVVAAALDAALRPHAQQLVALGALGRR